jgi:hypothetical protein
MKEQTHIITHELDKAIEKLAIWLSQQPDSAGIIRDTLKTLYSIRKNGVYNDKEKDLLNTLRTQYYLDKETENDL